MEKAEGTEEDRQPDSLAKPQHQKNRHYQNYQDFQQIEIHYRSLICQIAMTQDRAEGC